MNVVCSRKRNVHTPRRARIYRMRVESAYVDTVERTNAEKKYSKNLVGRCVSSEAKATAVMCSCSVHIDNISL